MARPGARDWMWGYAYEVIAQAQRLEGLFLRPTLRRGDLPSWLAPVDIYETETEIVMIVALPGVAANNLEVRVVDNEVVVAGTRPLLFPEGASLRRIEIPHGRFERRLTLPEGRYELAPWVLTDGCLRLVFRKAE